MSTNLAINSTMQLSTTFEMIANNKTLKIEELQKDNDLSAEVLFAYLQFLHLFGVIEFVENHEKIKVRSELAGYFIKSLSQLIHRHSVLIYDWDTLGVEFNNFENMLDKGVSLLYFLEKKRSSIANMTPLRKVYVCNAVIKAQSKDGKHLFLAMFNPKSQHFKLIGDYFDEQEKPEIALSKIIAEQLFHDKQAQDYFILKPILKESSQEPSLSYSIGVYTEYNVFYYYVYFEKQPQVSANHRWITLDELWASETIDGYPIITQQGLLTLPAKELAKLRPSISELVDYKQELLENSSLNESLRKKGILGDNMLKSTLSFSIIIAVTIGILSLAARFVPDYFNAILVPVIPLVIIALGFVARSSNLINAEQLVELVKISGKDGKEKKKEVNK